MQALREQKSEHSTTALHAACLALCEPYVSASEKYRSYFLSSDLHSGLETDSCCEFSLLVEWKKPRKDRSLAIVASYQPTPLLYPTSIFPSSRRSEVCHDEKRVVHTEDRFTHQHSPQPIQSNPTQMLYPIPCYAIHSMPCHAIKCHAISCHPIKCHANKLHAGTQRVTGIRQQGRIRRPARRRCMDIQSYCTSTLLYSYNIQTTAMRGIPRPPTLTPCNPRPSNQDSFKTHAHGFASRVRGCSRKQPSVEDHRQQFMCRTVFLCVEFFDATNNVVHHACMHALRRSYTQ